MLTVESRILRCDGLVLDPSLNAVEQDERSLALTEIDWTQVNFKNFLKPGETSITGEEDLDRQILSGHIRFGSNVLLCLWNDYCSNKEDSVLEWLYSTRQITLITFPGFVFLDSDGSQCVFYVERCYNGWIKHLICLKNRWGSRFVSGVLGQ